MDEIANDSSNFVSYSTKETATQTWRFIFEKILYETNTGNSSRSPLLSLCILLFLHRNTINLLCWGDVVCFSRLISFLMGEVEGNFVEFCTFSLIGKKCENFEIFFSKKCLPVKGGVCLLITWHANPINTWHHFWTS